MNIDQRIVVRGVLSAHGIANLAGIPDRELIQRYYVCRGTPVAVLFKPRRDVMPRRTIPARFRKDVT